MFLQSYIYRSTQTLHWLTATCCDLETICQVENVNTRDVLVVGFKDLCDCIHSYRGMTCVASHLLDIATNRKATDLVLGICKNTLRALAQNVPVHLALHLEDQLCLNSALVNMQRSKWDNWREAKVVCYRGQYCSGYSEGLFIPNGSNTALKCVAKYIPEEGVALQQTFERAQCDAYGEWVDPVNVHCDVRWHDIGKVNIPFSKVNAVYMDIFESDDVCTYRVAVLRYWIHLLSLTTVAAVS